MTFIERRAAGSPHVVPLTLNARDKALVARHQAERNHRETKFGKPRVNPFKRLRLAHAMTIKQLCEKAYVVHSAVIRLENGNYANPLPAVVEFWLQHETAECIRCEGLVATGGLTEGRMINAYEDFQLEQRRLQFKYFGVALKVDYHSEVHPFRQLRFNKKALSDESVLPVGLTQVSRELCLPLDTVQHFEKKWRTQQTVPKSIANVLNQIGYSRAEVDVFVDGYDTWRRMMIIQGYGGVDKGGVSNG